MTMPLTSEKSQEITVNNNKVAAVLAALGAEINAHVARQKKRGTPTDNNTVAEALTFAIMQEMNTKGKKFQEVVEEIKERVKHGKPLV